MLELSPVYVLLADSDIVGVYETELLAKEVQALLLKFGDAVVSYVIITAPYYS